MLRLRRLSLVAVLYVLASCRSAAPPQSQAPQVGWRPITKFNGRGSMQTESFNIESTQWRIKWQTKNDSSQVAGPVPGAFQVMVHSAVSGRPMLEAVHQNGPGQGVAYVTEDPRLYHLVIESSGIEWSLIVDEAVAAPRSPAN
jgi:hypothetical protein